MLFNNLVGNENVKQVLNKAIESDSIVHCYMFSGSDGVGKKQFAKEFAKAILCLEDNKPCNICKSCVEFENNNNPDFNIIESDRKNKNRANKANAREGV